MNTTTITDSRGPALTPPMSSAVSSPTPGAPTLSEDQLVNELVVRSEAAPSMFPPAQAALEGAGEGITVWHNGKKITALWSDQANRNSWISIAGMGWQKLATENDSSVVSLTLIAAHAEQTGATVNVRIEADQRVHEIYCW